MAKSRRQGGGARRPWFSSSPFTSSARHTAHPPTAPLQADAARQHDLAARVLRRPLATLNFPTAREKAAFLENRAATAEADWAGAANRASSSGVGVADDGSRGGPGSNPAFGRVQWAPKHTLWTTEAETPPALTSSPEGRPPRPPNMRRRMALSDGGGWWGGSGAHGKREAGVGAFFLQF